MRDKLVCALAMAAMFLTPSFAHAEESGSPPPRPTAPAPASASTDPRGSPSLSVTELMSAVERNHPALAAAKEDEKAARGDRMAADGGFDTSFRTRAAGTPLGYYRNFRVDSTVEQPTAIWGATVFGGYRLGRGDIAAYDGKLETNEFGELRAGVVVPTLRNGSIDRRRASRERGELGQKGAELGVSATALDIKRIGALRYWEWVAAGRRLAISKTLLEIALRRDEQISTRVARGDLPPIERSENARAILQRQAQRIAQERSFQQASIELSQYYRSASGVPIVPGEERLPDLSEPTSWPVEGYDAAVAAAVNERPDLKRLSIQKAQAKVEADFANNQKLPGLDFQVVVSKDFGDGLASRRPVELEAQVVLDVPIQNRVAKGRAEAARAMLFRVVEQERGAKDRVSAEVRDAMSAMDLARARLSMARREVEVSVELEKSEWSRFAAGDTTLLVVNLREQATFDARVREVDALAECQRALVQYRAATARLR